MTVLYVNSGADTDKGEKIGVTGSLEKASKVLDKTGATIYNTNVLYNGTTTASDIIVVDVTGKFDSDVYGNTLNLSSISGVEVTDADGRVLTGSVKVMTGDILTIKNTSDAAKTVTVTNAVDTNGGTVTAHSLAKGASISVIVKGAITISVA